MIGLLSRIWLILSLAVLACLRAYKTSKGIMAEFWADMFKFPMILPLEEKCLKDIFKLACTMNCVGICIGHCNFK